MNTKLVNMPIEVPDSDYCWDGHTSCRYFDNEGGHGSCTLGFYPVDKNMSYVYPKPAECKTLSGV